MTTNISKNNLSKFEMKIKYLERYYWIIQELLDELIRNNEDTVISASKISGMPKGQVIRTIDDVYIAKLKNKERISIKIERLYSKKKKIETYINNIDDPCYVLKSKYLFFKTFEEIAILLDKSTKQISRWHHDAIELIDIPELSLND